MLDRTLSLLEQGQRELCHLLTLESASWFLRKPVFGSGLLQACGKGGTNQLPQLVLFPFQAHSELALERRQKKERLHRTEQKTEVGGHASWLPGADPPASHI